MSNCPSLGSSPLKGVPNLRGHRIPCAAGHDVVYGLARGAGKEIYLAASNEFFPGLCATVFAFDYVTKKFRTVIDIEAATGFVPASGRMPHSKVHLSLNSARDGRAFACTHFTAPGIGQTDFEPISAYRQLFEGCCFLEYLPVEDRVINHGLLLKGEGARISCFDDARQQYYFLSYPRNHLFRYDCGRRSLHDIGRIGQENSFGLEVDDEGNVFTSDDLGRIIVYSFARNVVEETDLFIPLAGGRRPFGNYIRRMTTGPDGCFYGFSNKGARMFRLDPKRRTLDDLGIIQGREMKDAAGFPKLPPAKAIVPGASGSLLVAFGGDGIYVEDQPVPSLVRHELASGKTTDIGKFITEEEGSLAWIPQCGLSVLESGVAFFGLQQAVGGLRLWEVPLELTADPRTIKNLDSYEAHVAAIQKQPFGASVEGASALPFVKSGHVSMQELGWLGEGRVIPSGECGISGLCFVGETIYGVTSGRRSHLFSVRPYQQNRFTENYEVHPWDLGVLEEEPTIWARIFHDAASGQLLIAAQTSSSFSVYTFRAGEERKHYRGSYHSLPHWAPVEWGDSPFLLLYRSARTEVRSVTFLATPRILIWCTNRGETLSLGLRDGGAATVLQLELDSVLLVGVGTDRFAAVAENCVTKIFTMEEGGKLSAEKTLSGAFESPLCGAANASGSRLAIGTANGFVEVASSDGSGRRRSFQLRERWPILCLAWHPNGNIYGFYGLESGIGEAFAIDADSEGVREIGILQVSSQPRFWTAHRCEAAAVGPRGDIQFGEHDRISHLFSFWEGIPQIAQPRN